MTEPEMSTPDATLATVIDTYTAIKVITTDRTHDSGYKIMQVIGEKDTKDYILGNSADVIHWSFVSDTPWWMPYRSNTMMRTECINNYTRYYGARFVVKPGIGLSDIFIEVHYP